MVYDVVQGDNMIDIVDYYKIKVWYVKFDFSDMLVIWVLNDLGSMYIINMLNLLFLEGELWFCCVYNKVLLLIIDVCLCDEVEGFLWQEVVYLCLYGGVLKYYYDCYGIDMKLFMQKFNCLFMCVLGEVLFGLKIGYMCFWLWQ